MGPMHAGMSRPDGPQPPAPPSLAIVLLSAAVGLGSSVVLLYLAYRLAGLSLLWSVGLAGLGLWGLTALVAAGLAELYDPRTRGVHAAYGCGLVGLVLAFAGLCMLVGMVAGTLAFLLGQGAR